MLDGNATGAKTLTFDVATAAIKGKRDYQEDSLIASFPVGQQSGFAIIADGIGGHVAGHMASALATTSVFAHLKMLETELEDGHLNVPAVLRDGAEKARKSVAEHVESDQTTHGMGATLLVPVIRGDRLHWLSVGDSPLYLFRNGALRQLNRDHSMAPQIDMMVKTGALAAEKGRNHPDRNTLTSVINGDPIPEIDCPSAPILLKEGDILIAASDGLQALSNTALASALMESKDKRSIDLVDLLLAEIDALDNPDQDNTTFIVMKATATVGHQTERVIDLDAMPVLAQADAGSEAAAPIVATPAAVEEPVAEPEVAQPDERKAYYYRGQKYYRD